VDHKLSKYLYEVFKYGHLMFLKCVSSKFQNLECKILVLGVQFLKCTSRKFLDNILCLVSFCFARFLCMYGTIKLYSRSMYSLGCYSLRMQGFKIGLGLLVQRLKCPTRNFLG